MRGKIWLAVLAALSLAFGGACDGGGENGAADEDAASAMVVEGRSPLSGLPLTDPASLYRRAIAVKVENDPAARPQSGLDRAELVYEEMVEAGVTRFIALYLDSFAEEIGPVRSVRPTDIRVLEYYEPLLAASGGSSLVLGVLEASPINYITENDHPQCFYRTRDRRAPHNLYTSSTLMRQALRDMKLEEYHWSSSAFTFGEPGTEPGVVYPVTAIQVYYLGSTKVDYVYDSSRQVYLRNVGGQPHLDKTTGTQLAPATVIVQYVELEDTGVTDMAGNVSPDAMVVGSGEALVFSGGTLVKGTWSKENVTSRTVFLDEGGREVSILPGQVWIHMIPASLEVGFQ